jgi:hypothetical protein
MFRIVGGFPFGGPSFPSGSAFARREDPRDAATTSDRKRAELLWCRRMGSFLSLSDRNSL